ncbi:MAG: superoxide dismutase [FCB group bacterium]|nr:superoxide dismutase [FCB group bacterium]
MKLWNIAVPILAAMIALALPLTALAHCQIPCGIYDDQARFDLLQEHITTIEKSMKLITDLSAASEMNYSQIVRWVGNKEDHAEKFMTIVTDYFMAQRIKPVEVEGDGYATYQKKVELLHQMLVYAMKCKQTVEGSHTVKLSQLLEDFKKIYLAQ